MECLNWGNALTFKQKSQLYQSAEIEFIKLIRFLRNNKAFTCLMKGHLFKIEGEIGNILIGFYSYGQDIYYLHEDLSSGDPYYDHSFNNPNSSENFSVSLHERFEEYQILGNDVVKTRNELLNRRNKLLSKLGNSKQRKEHCIEALKKLEELKRMPELDDIEVFDLEIKGINGSLFIGSNGKFFGHDEHIYELFLIYGIQPQSIEKVKKDLKRQ